MAKRHASPLNFDRLTDRQLLEDGRWFGRYGRWHLNSGEADDDGRPPPNPVQYAHEDCDGSDSRKGWANTIAEAMAQCDALDVRAPSGSI